MDAVPRSVGVTGQSAQAKLNAMQVLEGSYTASLSNTVCVSDADGEWLSVHFKALEEFASYGDIARVDLSVVVVLKCVLLTFWDVRSAQQVLMNMADRTEPFPSLAHDCRMVRVKMPACFEKIPILATSGGFAHFGEVAHIGMSGGDAIVEYYDMRSAQMLLVAAGSTASPWMLATPGNNAAEQQLSAAFGMAGVARGAGMDGLGGMIPPSVASLAGGLFGGGAAAQAGAAGFGADAGAGGPRSPPPPPGLSRNNQGGLSMLAQAALAAEESSQMGCDSSPTTTTTTGGATNSTNSNSDSNEPMKTERVPARPVRTKVSTKEFSKYDIDPEKIQRGGDSRTTVMVRNLTGVRARKDFLRFLECCGLQERYTFFYMPCKEHRNIPAGFAFVNFVAPSDVNKLYVMVKSGFWRGCMTDPAAKVPAVSYARFQGHEELAKHFNSSAVLHEQDMEKRPIFRLEVLNAMKEQKANEEASGMGAGAGAPKVAAPRAKKAAPAPTTPAPATAEPAANRADTGTAGVDNAAGDDFQAALAKGVQEIAAILRRQELQAANQSVALTAQGA